MTPRHVDTEGISSSNLKRTSIAVSRRFLPSSMLSRAASARSRAVFAAVPRATLVTSLSRGQFGSQPPSKFPSCQATPARWITPLLARRGVSSGAAAFDHEKFTEEFLAVVADVPFATDPAQSSEMLRKVRSRDTTHARILPTQPLADPNERHHRTSGSPQHSSPDARATRPLYLQLVRSKVLKFTDMVEAPEKFFLAHRLLSTVGLGGFGIRFTVQFNLFAGSLVGLAGREQLTMLDDIQAKGQLGCFLLTEMQVRRRRRRALAWCSSVWLFVRVCSFVSFCSVSFASEPSA